MALKIRRGLESARTSITPADGEIIYTTDENKIYVGDGTTAGGDLVAGLTGDKGQKGEIGADGADGSIGVDGAKGQKGEIGADGADGSIGVDGAKGQKGEVGLGFNIAKTYSSVADLTADTSPTGIVSGEFAIIETGDNEDIDNSKLYLWNGSVYSYVSDLSGAAGFTGPAGADGSDGAAGVSGSDGAKGQKGEIGEAGVAGADGAVGDNGSLKQFTVSHGITLGKAAALNSDGTVSGIGDHDTTINVPASTGSLVSISPLQDKFGEGIDSAYSTATGHVVSIHALGYVSSYFRTQNIGYYVAEISGNSINYVSSGTAATGYNHIGSSTGSRSTPGITYDSSVDKFIWVGDGSDSSQYSHIRSASVAENGYLSLGDSKGLPQGFSDFGTIVSDQNGAGLIMWKAGSQFCAMTPYNISASGTLTVGSLAAGFSGQTTLPDSFAIVYDPLNDKFITIVDKHGYSLQAYVSSISGITATHSSPVQLGASSSSYNDRPGLGLNLATDGNGLFLISTERATFVGGITSGTSMSWTETAGGHGLGHPTQGNPDSETEIVYNTDLGKFVIFGRDRSTGHVVSVIATINGSNQVTYSTQTTISTTVAGEGAYGKSITAEHLPGGKTWVGYSIGENTTSSKSLIRQEAVTTGGVVTIDPSNYVGISANTADAGGTASVVLFGTAPTEQTLAINSEYYVLANGSFSDSDTTYSKIGRVVSTSEIYVSEIVSGDSGVDGAKGQKGEIGEAGAAGVAGVAGADGADGADGSIGVDGAKGQKGETGLGFSIAKSYISVAALTADTSPAGIASGEFAIIETGDNEDPDNSKLYLWNGSVYSYVSDLSGEAGVKGQTGDTGSSGVDGTKGQKGEVGVTGADGADGASGGGSKEFVAGGSITAGDPVVLNAAGTVSSVATIAANGTNMAAGHSALFPSFGNDTSGSYAVITDMQSYRANKASGVCATTGRAVFFSEQTFHQGKAYRVQGAVPNAASTEMTLGTAVSLQNSPGACNVNICFSGAGDGNFLVTYNPSSSYNDVAGSGLVARLGNVNSSGEITMYNSVTLETGRPLGYYGSNDYSASSADRQWKNSIVWDPNASKFVVVFTADFNNYNTSTWNANTKVGTAFLEYNGANVLSQNGGEALADIGNYGSYQTKLRALWDSVRSKVVTLYYSEDKTGSANDDNTVHFSVFEISDGLMSTPVAITTPVARASLVGTSLVNFNIDMEYNPTQQQFMMIPSSSYSGTTFFSFAFNGSAVSSVTSNTLPSTLLKGIDDTGVFQYRDIIYEASTDSVTIAYSAPNMTNGGVHANKQSIYTATLRAADYTLLSNIEAYDASYRGTALYNNQPTYRVEPAYYVDLNWSPILSKFIMLRMTDEEKQSTQQQVDRYISAYSLVQPTSISNYAETIGFSEGTVSDNTSVPVTLAAGINGNQSGLTIDTNYYFQANGSLATTETEYLAGLAISATELQVADLSDLDNVNLSLYASTSALAAKAPLADPTFTGVPAAPTATAGTNTTQLATTAFVTAANAAAGDGLPTQTDNSGKYLTTDGTDASWATVAAGAGYEIGDGLELTDPVTTVAWPASPVLTAQNDGTVAKPYLGHTLAATADYVVSGHGDGDDIEVYNARTGAFIRTIVVPQTYLGSLDIDGTTIIVGARAGTKAYLYNITTGLLLHTLTGTTPGFGYQVGISGNYAVVSDSEGALRVFNVTTGALLYTINNPNSDGGDTNDAFGQYGLAITSSYIIASAVHADPGGTANAGLVYIFDVSNGNLLCTRIPPTPGAGKRYGSDLGETPSISASGDLVAFRPNDSYPYDGSVHVHSITALISSPTSSPLYTLTVAGSGSSFGSTVSMSGDYLAVGAHFSSAGGFTSAGAAYLYDLTDGSLLYSVLGTSYYAKEGYAVAAAPGVFVTGAHDNFGSGEPGKIRIYNGTVSTNTYLQPDSTIATTSYVDTSVSNLVDSSPAALNTLNELAAALGDDANFSTTVTNSIATKAPLADPTFTGVPAAPTAAAGTNTTQIATTAFVTAANAAAGDGLPAQTDNSGKFLTTDGTDTSWATVSDGVYISDTSPASPSAGDLWMNSSNLNVYIYYNDGSSSQWVDVSTSTGGGGITFSEATSSATAEAGSTYIVDTSTAVTITLPSSAAIGDKIGIVDGTGNAPTNNITIARNGHNIQGLGEDMTVAKARAAFELVYYNTTNGWLLTSV